MERIPATLEQLPRTAATYYQQSVAAGLFTYAEVGRDDLGRKIYQKFLAGAEYGEPRALLSFAEFTAAVKLAARTLGPGVGVPRWTAPFYRN